MDVLARQYAHGSAAELAGRFHEQKEYLNSARPTAVNLSWALDRMERVVSSSRELPVAEIVKKLRAECRAVHAEDIEMCYKIS